MALSFEKCFPIRCWKKGPRLKKLYKNGEKRINKMINLPKLVKDNRNFKILLKNSLLSPEI